MLAAPSRRASHIPIWSMVLVAAFTLGALVLARSDSAASADAGMQSVVPARVLDTRIGPNYLTADGLFEGDGRAAAGSITEVRVGGRGGVPDDAVAVLVNVTAVSPRTAGFLTVFPCGEPVPRASNVNYQAGDVVPNAVLAKVGAGRRICVYSFADVHLLVDVNGYVPSGGSPVPLGPARLLETRTGPNNRTVDGQSQGIGRLAAGSVTEVVVAGRGGVPTGARAALLNVTAVGPSDPGFLTVYACGQAPPNASSVNYQAGQVVPNAVLAEIGDGGAVCVYTLAAADVLIDVGGFVPAGGSPDPMTPTRLLDTRGAPTVDGVGQGGGRLGAGQTIAVRVAGRPGVPSGVTAALLNVTAVNPSDAGFLTVHPCGGDRPLTSNVNYGAGEVVPNAVLARLGDDGQVCVFSRADTHLVVDIVGSVSGPEHGPTRVTDTAVAPPTTRAPGAAPTSGVYDYIAIFSGQPRRWNPCDPVRFSIDRGTGSLGQVDAVFDAIADVERATGLDFVFDRSLATEFVDSGDGAPEPYVPATSDAIITITDEFVAPIFDQGVLGYTYVGGPSDQARIDIGAVVLDSGMPSGIPFSAVALHELGHLVGLGHVGDDPGETGYVNELMQTTYRGVDTFGPGDREGLWHVGAAQSCLPAGFRAEATAPGNDAAATTGTTVATGIEPAATAATDGTADRPSAGDDRWVDRTFDVALEGGIEGVPHGGARDSAH